MDILLIILILLVVTRTFAELAQRAALLAPIFFVSVGFQLVSIA